MAQGVRIEYSEEQLAWMRGHYAETSNEECASHLGVSLRTAIRLARKLGLEKSAAYMVRAQANAARHAAEANRGTGNAGRVNLEKHRAANWFKPGVSPLERLGPEGEARRQAKAHASFRATVESERRRIRWGLEPRTRLHLDRCPAQRDIRHRLKRHGYVIPERGTMEVWYTADTRRSDRMERRAEGLGFVVASDVEIMLDELTGTVSLLHRLALDAMLDRIGGR